MKIILFGKNGQLGWELQKRLPALGEVVALGRNDLDISNIPALRASLQQWKPDLIINASAFTDVDRAETDSELAYQVNAIAPHSMAETACKLNATFIHYSTDYVFDGMNTIPYKEIDPPQPLNIYGRSKLQGEENIMQAKGTSLILRTSWVYSMRGISFVNKVLGWARKSDKLKIVSDQISNPTWARALAEITCKMFQQHHGTLKEKRGIYHLAGNGFVSRHEWARQILNNASDWTEELAQTIEPVSSEKFSTPAKRPLFTALDCSKFENTFGLHLPNWADSLREAMREKT